MERSIAWRGPGGAETYYDKSGAAVEVDGGNRWLQYKAVLLTPDGGSSPVLESVEIGARADGAP